MFVIVGVGALFVWYLRKAMPESPRWLESKGRTAEAEQVMREIEADIMDFCDGHPDEKFCGKLGLWLRQHPDPPR